MQNLDLCRDIVRQLWPYLDGALPVEWQERVIAHLADCDNCRSHYDFERAFLDAVRVTQTAAPDVAALEKRVMHSLVAAGMSLP